MSSGPSKCASCSQMDESLLLSHNVVKEELGKTESLWILAVKDEVSFLTRKFTAKHFQAALDCINEMGAIAERIGHHPDFHLTNYREVKVDIFTHKLSGVTQNDLDLSEIFSQEVKILYSPKWLRQNPKAQATAKED